MFLLRKKELDSFYESMISSYYDINHFDYHSFFYGNYKLSKFSLYDFNLLINDQEEISCIKTLLGVSIEKKDILEKHRSFISFFALIRNLLKSYSKSEIDIMSFYILLNCNWIDDISEESKKFWESSSGSLSNHKKSNIFKIAINSFVSNKLEKNKFLSFRSLILSFIPDYNSSNNLRNIYFFIKNYEKLKLLKDHSINFKNNYLKFYKQNRSVNEKLSIEKFCEYFYYIPEDTMAGIFQNMYEKEILIPYCGNIILTDKFKDIFSETYYYQNKNTIDQMRKIHYNIISKNTLIHRCEDNDLLETFERICNGKMRVD